MLATQVLTPPASMPFPMGDVGATVPLKATKSVSARLFSVAFSSVEMDGSNLWSEPVDVAYGQLIEGVRLTELRGKSELLIGNIAPWMAPGQVDPAQVSDVETQILDILADVCTKLGHEMPVCRLALQNGEFSIRCYLGRDKPTDHVFGEDWLSDTR